MTSFEAQWGGYICEMARFGGSRPKPNLAYFNIAMFSIISALSVGPAVKFLPC